MTKRKKKNEAKKQYMRAPRIAKPLKPEVYEKCECKCSECHKDITFNQASLYLRNKHRRDKEMTAEKLKILCPRCANKFGMPYQGKLQETPSKKLQNQQKLVNDKPTITKLVKPKVKPSVEPVEKPVSTATKRKVFTKEERAQILKQNYSICACCGKKLTAENMTIEHIIPLHKGGTNDIENLTVLCQECNQLKNNDLYLAEGFYSALVNKPRHKEISHYVNTWYHDNIEKLDLVMNPMIAPHFNSFHIPFNLIHNKKKLKYTPQFLYQISFVPEGEYGIIKSMTGMDTKEIAAKINESNKTKNKHVAFYTCKKVTSDRIFMVVAMLWDPEQHMMNYYIPWSETKDLRFNATFVYRFVENTLIILNNIAEEPIDEFVITHHSTESMIAILCLLNTSGLATGYRLTETLPGTDKPLGIRSYRYDPESEDENKRIKPSERPPQNS